MHGNCRLALFFKNELLIINMNYWLLKSEPYEFSYQDLEKKGRAMWDGVRNYEARNNLRKMKEGDLALFYHSKKGLEIVGVCEVVREAYPDPTAEKGDWSVVDVKPVKAFTEPVSLKEIKEEPGLENMALVKRSRLSISPVTEEEFEVLLEMGKTNLE
jgi:predicted RNA-binding protein with PUA-like domain